MAHTFARLRAVAAAIALALAALITLPASPGWAATARHPAATCCTVTVNGPAVTMTVSKKGATAKQTFRGSAGQQVSEVLTNLVVSDQGCVTVTLLGPGGGTVDSTFNCGASVGVGPDTLSVTGVYTVELQLDKTATGHGKLWVSVPASVGPVTVNGPDEAMNVTRVGQGVERSFAGTAGQQVTTTLTNVVTTDGGCATLTLLDPTGTTVDSTFACGNGTPIGLGPDTLDATGTYTVLYQPDNTATSTSKLWLSAPVSVGTVTVNGAAQALDVTRVGQGVQRTFAGQASQKVTATVGSITTSDSGCATVTVLNASGAVLGSANGCGAQVSVGPVKLNKTAAYTVLLQLDTIATGTGSLTVTT